MRQEIRRIYNLHSPINLNNRGACKSGVLLEEAFRVTSEYTKQATRHASKIKSGKTKGCLNHRPAHLVETKSEYQIKGNDWISLVARQAIWKGYLLFDALEHSFVRSIMAMCPWTF